MKSILISIIVISISQTVLSLNAQDAYSKALMALENGDYAAAAQPIREAVAEKPNDIHLLVLATQVFLELDDVAEAHKYAQRAYTESDGTGPAARQLSLTLSRLARHPDAVSIMRKAVKKTSKDVADYLVLTDVLIAADSVSSAELIASTARDKFPKDARAYVALGNIYFNYKPAPVFELARQNFEKAIELDENLVLAHFNLAQCYWRLANREADLELGNELFKRSLVSWNNVARLDPTNARAYYEQGKIFFLSKKFPESVAALTEYRKLRPRGTGEVMASWWLGKALYEMRRCDEAREHLDDAANRIDTIKTEAELLMARCFFISKDFQRSAEKYREPYAKGLVDSLDLWYYGTTLIVTGDTTQGVTVMMQAADKDPGQCILMFRLGMLLLQRGQYDEAIDVYRRRLSNCSDSLDSRIYSYIGNAFFTKSKVDSAIMQYQRSIALDSNYLYAQQRLGDAYADQQLEAEAISVYKSCAARWEADPRMAETCLIRLCGIALKAKDTDGLIGYARKGTDLNPKSEFLWLYLGIGYQLKGDSDKAKSAYKKTLEINPANQNARDNLKGL